MTLDISALRKMKSSSTQEFAKIAAAFQQTTTTSDSRFFKLEGDAAGNASAVIRFLPKHAEDELPWVKYYSHSFKMANGRWYSEKSLTTLGEADPVGEENGRLWDTGSEENKKIASARSRKLSYITNILVLSDPKHPENNGKVMLYKFGKTIFDKIMAKGQPIYEGDEAIDVFDLWAGATFRLKMKQKAGWPNYDDSQFDSPSELYDGDEQRLLNVINSQYKLAEFVDRSQFKSYDELKAKFLNGMSNKVESSGNTEQYDIDKADMPAPSQKSADAPKPKYMAPPEPAKVATKVETEASPSDEDELDYFRNLAKSS